MKYRKILIILTGSLLLGECAINASFLSKLFGSWGSSSSDSKSAAEKPWIVKTGKTPYSVAFSPNGQLAAVANFESHNVSVYTVDATSGTFTPVQGSPFAAGSFPSSIAFSPNGQLAAVTNMAGHNVSVYLVNAQSGAFMPVQGSPFVAGLVPCSVAFSPDGKLAVVTNRRNDTVSIYTVDAKSGAFTPVPNSPFATGSQPTSVAFSPNGKFLAVTNEGKNTVDVYAVNAQNGALMRVRGAPFIAGLEPRSVAFSPNGQLAAVVNKNDNIISVFRVDADTGLFTPLPGSPFKTESYPRSVAFSPNGKLVAVTNLFSNAVSVYAVDVNKGVFTQSSTVATGDSPISIAFSPTSEIAAVANSGDYTLWIYEVDEQTGKFTPITGGLLPAFQRKEEFKKTKKSFEEFGEQKHTTEEGERAGLGGTIPGPIEGLLGEYIVEPKAAKESGTPKLSAQEIHLQKAIAQTQQDRLHAELNKTLLFAAIKFGDLKAVQENLTPFTINSINEQRRTPLMEAVLHENKNLVELLLAYKYIQQDSEYHPQPIVVNTAIGDAEGDTALMLAIRHKKFELAVIIENHMNPSEFALKNKEGKTAFDLLKEKKPSEHDKWYDILNEILQ